MRTILLLAILIGATGCTTMKQAQTDFQNFQKTIQYNSIQPVVYPKNYF